MAGVGLGAQTKEEIPNYYRRWAAMPDGKRAKPSEQLSDEVFELLKRKGPLCASQISLELLLPLAKVQKVLASLNEDGLVEIRPSRDQNTIDKVKSPWRLSRSRRPKVIFDGLSKA
jgi:transcription initiation factor IIE alpha subunit